MFFLVTRRSSFCFVCIYSTKSIKDIFILTSKNFFHIFFTNILFFRIPDEWFPLESAPTIKTVKLGQLPESAKCRLQEKLHLVAPTSALTFNKHPRKRKIENSNLPPSANGLKLASSGQQMSSLLAHNSAAAAKQRRLMTPFSRPNAPLSAAAIAKMFL